MSPKHEKNKNQNRNPRRTSAVPPRENGFHDGDWERIAAWNIPSLTEGMAGSSILAPIYDVLREYDGYENEPIVSADVRTGEADGISHVPSETGRDRLRWDAAHQASVPSPHVCDEEHERQSCPVFSDSGGEETHRAASANDAPSENPTRKSIQETIYSVPDAVTELRENLLTADATAGSPPMRRKRADDDVLGFPVNATDPPPVSRDVFPFSPPEKSGTPFSGFSEGPANGKSVLQRSISSMFPKRRNSTKAEHDAFPPPKSQGEFADHRSNTPPRSSVGSDDPPLRRQNARSDSSGVTKTVKRQYEMLPYPPRDPENDKRFLAVPMIDHLMVVNQRCYGGKRDFHSGFRVLVAGGGTGDASTALAVQCAALPDVEIHYIDLSEESLNIAKQRLHNQAVRLSQPRIEAIVAFHNASLLDLESMELGSFDYINCAGVLHHLENPSDGLRVLKDALNERGAMGLMVYGRIGRTSVYHVQEMMRIVNRGIEDVEQKIRNTNLLLQTLPETNLHVRNGRWKANEADPIEIYDLFLHSNDRAYTVGQLYDAIEEHGLCLNTFTASVNAYLDPRCYPNRFPETILEKIEALPRRQRQAVSEYLFGHINKLECYVTRFPVKAVETDDPEVIPSFSVFAKKQNLPQRLRGEREIVSTFVLPDHFRNRALTVFAPPLCKAFLREIDGRRTVEEIRRTLLERYPRLSERQYEHEVAANLNTLVRYDMLHLRTKQCRCELLNCDRF